ncbi:MAG TPA: histidine kinase N-terminal 7TM domain-containing protein [Patescibacteria group bacterium]|nr:histidine kinase N-terminal 7TM domain-containing protein [Patescibacteria group bacterium]
MMPVVSYFPIPNIPFVLLVVAGLISMSTYIWKFKKNPGAKPQVFAQVCKGIWLVALVMASTSGALADKMFWRQLCLTLSMFTAYIWLIFVLEISNQREKVPPIVKNGFLAVVILLAIGIMTNPWHGLFWSDAWLDGPALRVVIGSALWTVHVSSYLICIIALTLSVRWIRITAGLRRRQALWFSMATIFSLLGNVLDNIPSAQWLAPLPLGFLLTGLCMTWGFYRWQVYNVLPLAKNATVKNMFDGLLVVDEYGYIVEINAAAQKALAGLPAFTGGKFRAVTDAWPTLATPGVPTDLQTREVVRQHAEGNFYYQVRETSLETVGYWLGKVIVLKDITQEKQNQAKLMEQEKALSIMAERDRLGRELHDGSGQIWSYVNMQLETACTLFDKKDFTQMESILRRLTHVTQEVHIDIRESISGLKTVALEHGLVHALEEYFQWFRQNYEIEVHLTVKKEFTDDLITLTSKVQLLRIIQEALANIRKHAGATSINIVIGVTESLAEVRVEDNGCGFDPAKVAKGKGHFGLRIMQERAAEMGAQFRVEATPNLGTTVIIEIPRMATAI